MKASDRRNEVGENSNRNTESLSEKLEISFISYFNQKNWIENDCSRSKLKIIAQSQKRKATTIQIIRGME